MQNQPCHVMETFLSPVGLHGFGNIQSLGSVKQQGKMSGWGGKGYNRSHWNVEMCVYKRPVNSCLK